MEDDYITETPDHERLNTDPSPFDRNSYFTLRFLPDRRKGDRKNTGKGICVPLLDTCRQVYLEAGPVFIANSCLSIRFKVPGVIHSSIRATTMDLLNSFSSCDGFRAVRTLRVHDFQGFNRYVVSGLERMTGLRTLHLEVSKNHFVERRYDDEAGNRHIQFLSLERCIEKFRIKAIPVLPNLEDLVLHAKVDDSDFRDFLNMESDPLYLVWRTLYETVHEYHARRSRRIIAPKPGPVADLRIARFDVHGRASGTITLRCCPGSKPFIIPPPHSRKRHFILSAGVGDVI